MTPWGSAGKPVPWQQWAARPSSSSSWVQSRPQVRQTRVQVPVLPLTGCVALGLLLRLSKPQFRQLCNGALHSFCLTELWRESEKMVIESV